MKDPHSSKAICWASLPKVAQNTMPTTVCCFLEHIHMEVELPGEAHKEANFCASFSFTNYRQFNQRSLWQGPKEQWQRLSSGNQAALYAIVRHGNSFRDTLPGDYARSIVSLFNWYTWQGILIRLNASWMETFRPVRLQNKFPVLVKWTNRSKQRLMIRARPLEKRYYQWKFSETRIVLSCWLTQEGRMDLFSTCRRTTRGMRNKRVSLPKLWWHFLTWNPWIKWLLGSPCPIFPCLCVWMCWPPFYRSCDYHTSGHSWTLFSPCNGWKFSSGGVLSDEFISNRLCTQSDRSRQSTLEQHTEADEPSHSLCTLLSGNSIIPGNSFAIAQ